jgi:glycosyltransferase involved in cell wall biosynthesis
MKKRILLVSPFPPYIGGVSVSVQRLYDHLRYSGYEPVKYNTQILNKRYNLKALKFLKYLALPFYLMLNRRFDVIHFHVSKMMPKIYVSAWRRFFSSKTRFVITIHGEIHDAFMNDIGRLALEGFDRIICVKQATRKICLPNTGTIQSKSPPLYRLSLMARIQASSRSEWWNS